MKLHNAEWYPLRWVDNSTVEFIKVQSTDCTGGHDMIFERKIGNRSNPTVQVQHTDIPITQFHPALYIMHTAYGGSTLISRMLSECNAFTSYMEPQMHIDSQDDRIPQLITRPFNDELVAIKTTPNEMEFFNQYDSRHPDNKFVILHQSLRSFLVSCFKDDRRLEDAIELMCNSMQVNTSEIKSNEDAARIFIGFWSLQMTRYKEVINRYNVLVIDSNELLKDPISSLLDIASFTNTSISELELDHISHKWVNNHSKYGTPFTYTDRVNLEHELYIKYKELFDSLNINDIPEQYNLAVK